MDWSEAAQIIASAIGAAVSARWGHQVILNKLASYITVAEYKEKTASLHEQINSLNVRIAVLEDRQRAK